MNVNCSTCLELLTPSCELSSAPCGHVFHSNCISTWLQTGKDNCPQCRSKCKFNQLRRIYFTEGIESTDELDANFLQNRLDSLTFQLRCSETEKKKYEEKYNELTAHKLAMKEEIKDLEKKLRNTKDDASSYRNQVKILQGEKERLKHAHKRANELEERLKLYQTVEISLKGTLPQMMDRLHSLNDYSENARQLCEVAEQLKKELVNKGSEVKQLAKALQQQTNQCSLMKSKKDENAARVHELSLANNKLRKDMEHIEEENNDLRTKLNKLQEAIVSPSGDAKSSAIARLVSENPAPQFLGHSPPTPKVTVKSCGIVGLKKFVQPLRSPCKNVTNDLKRSLSVQEGLHPVSLFSKKAKTSASASQPEVRRDMFYNGLGGHSKSDEFPVKSQMSQVKNTFTLSKKPKGVSRPTVKPSKHMKTMDQFFTLDTP